MLLTVFIMDVFWKRDLVRSFADHTEAITLIFMHDSKMWSDSLLNADEKQWQQSFLEKTGAVAGILLDGKGDVVSFGQYGDFEFELREGAIHSYSLNKTGRTLLGTSWNFFVPARKYLILSLSFPEGGAITGAIALLYRLEPVYSSVGQSQRYIFAYLFINIIVLTVVGLFRFYRFTVRPLEQLVRLTDAYEEEGTVPFLALEQGNEFGQLSSALHQMLQRIEEDKKKLRQNVLSLETANNELLATREEMVRTEKLASVGRLAAGLAHEIGNPIGVVQGYLGLLQQSDITDRERNDFARRSERELQRIDRLIRLLLDFSRPNSDRQDHVSIHSILRNQVEMVSCQPFMAGIGIKTNFTAADDIVLGSADQLQQVFFNCLLNAADAINTIAIDKPSISIDTLMEEKRSESNTAKFIQVRITDNGAGIAEDDCANIFDPFFTTKEPGKGTGLGLSVSYSIVEQYGGAMRVESQLGRGTTMIVGLPLVGDDKDIGNIKQG